MPLRTDESENRRRMYRAAMSLREDSCLHMGKWMNAILFSLLGLLIDQTNHNYAHCLLNGFEIDPLFLLRLTNLLDSILTLVNVSRRKKCTLHRTRSLRRTSIHFSCVCLADDLFSLLIRQPFLVGTVKECRIVQICTLEEYPSDQSSSFHWRHPSQACSTLTLLPSSSVQNLDESFISNAIEGHRTKLDRMITVHGLISM